jgi:hypothetical protein
MSRQTRIQAVAPKSDLSPGFILQRKGGKGSQAPENLSMMQNALRSSGQPLDSRTRAYMEPRFGHDFSRVRVHTNVAATESARELDALAYTVGPNIVFADSQYSPDTLGGRKLLAHELTHVVQQSAAGPLRIQRQAAGEKKQKATTDAESKTPAAVPAVESTSAAVVSDTDIDALDLSATVKERAKELKTKHPDISFTSGRRDVASQAQAMAINIVTSKDRKWIEHVPYTAAGTLQKWVDNNPKATTVAAIAKGLEDTMNGMSETDRGKVSKHLTGEAFDVQPQVKDADAIKKDIRALSGLSKFLEKEAGLDRWHAQFKRAPLRSGEYEQDERDADGIAEAIARPAMPVVANPPL